jgi:hypothetical protein
LESDLVDKASSIADSKAAISGRVASVDRGPNKDIQVELSTSMAHGSGNDGSEKLTAKVDIEETAAKQVTYYYQQEATNNRGLAPRTHPTNRPSSDA